MRFPLRPTRALRLILSGGEIGVGAIVEWLHRVGKHAEPGRVGIKGLIPTRPAVHADDTGWREDGVPAPRPYGLTKTSIRKLERSSQTRSGQRLPESWAVIFPQPPTAIRGFINGGGSLTCVLSTTGRKQIPKTKGC
jgi:hypothetical protein